MPLKLRYDWPPTKGELLDLNLSSRFTKDLGGPAKNKGSGRPVAVEYALTSAAISKYLLGARRGGSLCWGRPGSCHCLGLGLVPD